MSPLRQSSPARSTGARSARASRSSGTARSGRTARRRTPVVDPACAEAVDLAREAAQEVAATGTTQPSPSGAVGDHLGLRAEGDRVVTHYFACLNPAYRGWHWAVTVTRAARAKVVTVSECALLPGEDALLAPEWVPWLERLRPGDLGPGDLLPTAADDVRLAPGYADVGDSGDQQMQWELGLGRPRVLSREGRAEAAARWYDGIAGPRAPIAASAPAQCSTCGFYVPLAGELRQMFGVCANEYAPDDGRVVSADHGCGAHSEAVVVPPASEHGPPVLDEVGYDIVKITPARDSGDDGSSETPSEEEEALGHS
ncbi:DUF3027 domain-containing protein [Actinomadura sp. NBRC 104425]|uniref:DUF3027 domain-containing protein n=1 Tax=Actinomadura sp. NBRC 104425 TaxID=3032204 RepID=UPI0033238F5C